MRLWFHCLNPNGIHDPFDNLSLRESVISFGNDKKTALHPSGFSNPTFLCGQKSGKRTAKRGTEHLLPQMKAVPLLEFPRRVSFGAVLRPKDGTQVTDSHGDKVASE